MTSSGQIRAAHEICGLEVHHAKLSYQDEEYLREVFWDLFLQRIIVLGMRGSDTVATICRHFVL